MTRPDSLTIEEHIIMDHLIEAWNSFVKLGKQHPSENTDFMDGIHTLEAILGMRILRREHSDIFPVKIKEQK